MTEVDGVEELAPLEDSSVTSCCFCLRRRKTQNTSKPRATAIAPPAAPTATSMPSPPPSSIADSSASGRSFDTVSGAAEGESERVCGGGDGGGGGGDGGGGGGGSGVSIVGAGGGGEGGGSEGGGSAGGDEGGGGATTRATLTFAAVATLVASGVTSTPRREASCAVGALTRVVAAASTVDVTAAAVAWLPSGAVSGMVRMTSTLMPLVEARRRSSAMRRPVVARSSRKHAGSRHDSSFLRLASSVAFSGDASKEATSRASTAITKETTVEATETTA